MSRLEDYRRRGQAQRRLTHKIFWCVDWARSRSDDARRLLSNSASRGQHPSGPPPHLSAIPSLRNPAHCVRGIDQARPTEGLTITAQGSFNDAVLTQDIPGANTPGSTYGLAGDRLPYAIRWSGGITVKQDISLPNAWIGFVGGALNYIGSFA